MSNADSLSPLAQQLLQLMPGMPAHDLPRFERSITASEPYALGSDSLPREGVPRGKLTHQRFEGGAVYPGVSRDCRLYVPAQYDGAKPACLMVFNDGARYLGPEIAVPSVFDNLIADGAMPVTIGVFVDAGEIGPGLPLYGGSGNRSIEYDSLDDAYARFLIDELLPALTQGLRIDADPAARAICGLSSGGIAAFTVAWHRPDVFGKVVSHCGSFVDIRGGHAYPSLIRRAEPKPLRVFLQTGENDLDIVFGHWPSANRALAAALAYRGYEHRLVVGSGGHSLVHGGAIFPETMRWLWRDRRTA